MLFFTGRLWAKPAHVVCFRFAVVAVVLPVVVFALKRYGFECEKLFFVRVKVFKKKTLKTKGSNELFSETVYCWITCRFIRFFSKVGILSCCRFRFIQ